jgi:hypothetical protein
MMEQVANSALLIVVVGVAIASIVQAVSDPRITPAYLRQSLIALAAYAAHGAASIVLLVFVVPQHIAPWGLGVALVGWLGLGLMILLRLAPDAETRPGWVRRFGFVDVICLALIAVGLAAATGLF